MVSTNNKSIYFLLIVPIISFLTIIFSTRFFIGITPDSMMYVSAAQSFIDTGELKSIYEGLPLQYMTHYPPGLSLIISFINIFTNNLYDAARVLNAFSIFGLLLAVGIVINKLISLKYTVILQIILMINLSLLTIYEMLWTEPIFMFLSFIALYSIYLFVNTKKIKWLLLSAILLSISVLVRYVGVSLIITSTIYLWVVLKDDSFWTRIKYMFILGIISSSSFVYWTARNLLLVDNPTDRHFAFHPMPLEYYKEWMISTTKFFIGLSVIDLSYLITLIIGAILIIALITYSIKTLIKTTKDLNYILVLYPSVYFIFLFTSNTFFDFTPLYFRTLSPVYLFYAISIFIILSRNNKIKSTIKISFISIILILYGGKFAEHLIKINDGKELSSSEFMNTEIINELNKLDPNTYVYTNEVDRFYLLTDGRLANWLRKIKDVKEKEFIIVYFYNGRPQSLEALNQSAYSITTITKTKDMIISKYIIQ